MITSMELFTNERIKTLSRMGYWTLYGKDGKVHIVPRNQRGFVTRGTPALCGKSASKHGYENIKPACLQCIEKFVHKITGEH